MRLAVRHQEGDLEKTLASSKNVLESRSHSPALPTTNLARALIQAANQLRQTPMLRYDQGAEIPSILSQGLPLVVSGVERVLQGAWDAKRFADIHGHLRANLIEIDLSKNTEIVVDTTVGQFFERYFQDNMERGTIVKLKVGWIARFWDKLT